MTLPIIVVAEYDARVPRNNAIINTLRRAGVRRSRIFTPRRWVEWRKRGWYRCFVIRLPDEDDPTEIIRQAYPCERGKPGSFMCRGQYYSVFKKYAKGG